MEEIPQFGFTLSEVTRNLHEHGPIGIMTDYEAKFYEQGLPINRLVATMVEPWEEPFPKLFKTVKNRWLDAFADNAPEAELGQHVLSQANGRNFLWHLFSFQLVPCLEGEDAFAALQTVDWKDVYLFDEGLWGGNPVIQPVPSPVDRAFFADRQDVYLVDKAFTWTFAYTHEANCGPYFCRIDK